MADEQELIVEEIYEYYKDKRDASEKEEEGGEPREEKRTAFFSAAAAFSDITDRLAKNPADKRGVYITLAAAAAVMIVMVGAITGFLLPKNEERIAAAAEELKQSDARYQDALKENEKLKKRVDTLYNTKIEVNAELENLESFEDDRKSSEEDIKAVEAQLEELNALIAKKQSEVNELDVKIRGMGSKVTLTPGMYTVGVQISAGDYNVKGDGSLLVSDSQNKLKVNTRLTETTAYNCRLSAGDKIKLETKAEFNAAG